MLRSLLQVNSCFFFLNDPATPEIYTLPLHDALPISRGLTVPARPAPGLDVRRAAEAGDVEGLGRLLHNRLQPVDRKSTRLNSSHANISYAVFCLKKKKKTLLNSIPNHR